MFYEIFLSPQVKRIMIINNKHGIYELPNDLIRKLGNICLIYFGQDCKAR